MRYRTILGFESEINEVLNISDFISKINERKCTYIIKDGFIICEIELSNNDNMFLLELKYPDLKWNLQED